MFMDDTFDYARCLTVLNKDLSYNAVTNDSVKLFRHYLSQVPLYINPEDELSHTHHELFALTAGTLLSTMQETVNPGIPQTSGDDDGLDQNPLYKNPLLQKNWPRLLGLAYLQDKGRNGTGFLVLRQDICVFKRLQDNGMLFVNLAKYILPGDTVQTIKPPSEPSSRRTQERQSNTAQVRELFYDYSKRLFAGIVQRLAGCQSPHSQSPHKALLHLKGPSDAHDGKPAPKLTMFVAFCPERNTWQQVVCSEHVASTGSASDDSSAYVDDICELAQSCSDNGCILGVELKGDTLLDTSDQGMDEKLSLLDNASVTEYTLHELLRRGIFQDSYKVFPNDKKILAYILARALLCLYGGPWLQTPWSADKLVFRYDAAAQTIYDVHQPYILCDLREGMPPPVSGKLHNSPPVLAFAKILVDLDQGFADETSYATDGALLKTVKKYYDEKKDRSLSPGYKKALYSSIFFNKHLRDIQHNDPYATIQDAILEGIVKPLENDVQMDKKDQWGCRNVKLENNTLVMAPPAIPGKPPARRPPRTQHPTMALLNKPQTGINTTASRLPVRPKPTRPGPASRPETPAKISGVRSGTTGIRTASRQTVSNTSVAAPHTIAPRHTQSSHGNGRGMLCRIPDSDSKISTDTFRYMNFVADEYLQHTEDDTPIRVAVIGTGIDREHADFQMARTKKFRGHQPNPARSEQPQKDRIRACKNFCKDPPDDDVSDLDGHGTQVAGIILRLAPNAELYIARVCTGDTNYSVGNDKVQQRRRGEY